MPRKARQPSQSGIYHIILRGINKQVIFEDEEDNQKFLWYLAHYKEISQYSIYGYCLMYNHIHLMLQESQEPVAHVMKRIGVSYVSWYNRKYGRYGHLFQDRFKSEAVETDEYFLTVLRYIHQNPLKSGEGTIETYPWSSYRHYVEGSDWIDTAFALGIFSSEPEIALNRFKQFMNEKPEETAVMSYTSYKLTDQDAKLAIQNIAKVSIPVELQTIEKEKRDELLRRIKKVEGISTRQIARLTGISQSVIARA
ncbi:transposase [Acetonema longum]|uniref:Transposase IS200-like domain-containing protein n=1 Tax=Acetonema longum DSM 6540 TaxID=1009370 RepID=F7NIH4_9FIRM|nr:transposase [Acetonema longum]EGO64120.1 hypothetical protein ALO_09384 [Acetonema longum DSM 6540]